MTRSVGGPACVFGHLRGQYACNSACLSHEYQSVTERHWSQPASLFPGSDWNWSERQAALRPSVRHNGRLANSEQVVCGLEEREARQWICLLCIRRHPHLQHRSERSRGCGSGAGQRLGWRPSARSIGPHRRDRPRTTRPLMTSITPSTATCRRAGPQLHPQRVDLRRPRLCEDRQRSSSAGKPPTARTTRFDVSNDHVNWTTIKTVTGGHGGTDDLTGLSGRGRYARMHGSRRGISAGHSLYEMNVYVY